MIHHSGYRACSVLRLRRKFLFLTHRHSILTLVSVFRHRQLEQIFDPRYHSCHCGYLPFTASPMLRILLRISALKALAFDTFDVIASDGGRWMRDCIFWTRLHVLPPIAKRTNCCKSSRAFVDSLLACGNNSTCLLLPISMSSEHLPHGINFSVRSKEREFLCNLHRSVLS